MTIDDGNYQETHFVSILFFCGGGWVGVGAGAADVHRLNKKKVKKHCPPPLPPPSNTRFEGVGGPS